MHNETFEQMVFRISERAVGGSGFTFDEIKDEQDFADYCNLARLLMEEMRERCIEAIRNLEV